MLVDAVKLCLAISCLMRSAAIMHIYGFAIGALDTAHGPRQHFGVLTLFCLPLVGIFFHLFFELDVCCSFTRRWRSTSSRRLVSTFLFSSSGQKSFEGVARSSLSAGSWIILAASKAWSCSLLRSDSTASLSMGPVSRSGSTSSGALLVNICEKRRVMSALT